MNDTKKMICPVCGSEKISDSLSLYTCRSCGFSLAFVNNFASKESLEAYEKLVEEAKADRMPKQTEKPQEKPKSNEQKWKEFRYQIRVFNYMDHLFLSGNTVAYLSSDHILYLIQGNGTLMKVENVLHVSLSERNTAIVSMDGTVKVIGSDNGFGQQDTEDWKDIVSVLCTTDATYGVTKAGKVVVTGAPLDDAVENWSHMKQLYGNDHLIVGLTKNLGIRSTEHWKLEDKGQKVSRLAVSDNAIAALTFTEDENKKRKYSMELLGAYSDKMKEAQSYSGILTLAMDHDYIYAIDVVGKMHQAGECIEFLDQDRKKAANWSRLVTVATNETAVAAISSTGVLAMYGNVSGDLKVIRNTWNQYVKPVFLKDFANILNETNQS